MPSETTMLVKFPAASPVTVRTPLPESPSMTTLYQPNADPLRAVHISAAADLRVPHAPTTTPWPKGRTTVAAVDLDTPCGPHRTDIVRFTHELNCGWSCPMAKSSPMPLLRE